MKNKRKVKIEINIEDEKLFKLFLIAHEKDITLNELIEEIILEYAKSCESPH